MLSGDFITPPVRLGSILASEHHLTWDALAHPPTAAVSDSLALSSSHAYSQGVVEVWFSSQQQELWEGRAALECDQ